MARKRHRVVCRAWLNSLEVKVLPPNVMEVKGQSTRVSQAARDGAHPRNGTFRPRLLWGGAVGYLLKDGSFDSCIVIRSLRYRPGLYHTRAGAGMVADSIPEREIEGPCGIVVWATVCPDTDDPQILLRRRNSCPGSGVYTAAGGEFLWRVSFRLSRRRMPFVGR